jgi:metal-responsive CopG/Arc/MetJ family transcriptional regulator
MPKRDYVSVSLPKPLMDIVDEIVESEKPLYSSRAEFINDAVRIRLRELGKIK